MARSGWHVYRRRIAFAETDAAGVAHFSAVLCLAEEAEHDLLRREGVAVLEEGAGWPRVAVRAEFRAPLRFGEEAEVRIRAREAGESAVTWEFEVRARGAGRVAAASGEMTVCHVRRDEGGAWRPAALPERVAALAGRGKAVGGRAGRGAAGGGE